MAMTGTEPLVFNPYAWDFHEDPFPIYRRLRDEAPAYHNPDLGFWALSRHEDVLAALHDPDTYCSRHGITLEARSPLPMMITMDPPDHTAMRRLVSRAFTPKRISDLEADIRTLSSGYLDEMAAVLADQGVCDLIADYAAKLPMDVISRMMGVPADDQDMLRHWTDLMLIREEGVPDVPPAGEEAGLNLFTYLLDHVRSVRAAGAEGDDLLSALIQVEAEDGRRLDDIEVVAFGFLLIIAGNETTTKLLGNAAFWLTRFPDERRKLLDDPSLVPDAVEEILRYEGSTQLMARTLTRDTELHGCTMAEGTRVLLLGSANRDDRVWPDPDRFDITRERPVQHLAFGHGVHVCLGAALARLEMKVSLEEIHRRFPAYEVDHDACVRIHSGNVRGYSSVPFQA